MNCMKCGREIALGQVFCKDCLAEMQQHPVKSDTPIQLPPVSAPVQTSRRAAHKPKVRKPEEQIARLRKLVRFQTIALLVMLVLFIASTVYILTEVTSQEPAWRPGQNYSSVEDNTTN